MTAIRAETNGRSAGDCPPPDRTHARSAHWPDLRFRGRRLYVRDGLVVSEWTATATHADGRRLEWDGIDVFPFENGLILRKDVYSAGHRPRVVET